ncbi:MAG: CotH kinase family protein [Lachnospiraceae bacterium]|nr:CotH kinase family protein [Lachnospiraceae bacterium]
MSTHKHIDKICYAVIAFTMILTVFFMNAEAFGVCKESNVMEYENKLFNTSTVHAIDIVIDDWDEFTEHCQSEEYYNCTVVIDDEMYKNVAIRGKGNTSLTQVSSYGNDRYSFKIEFDHYDSSNTYYGLDKLCLNNMIQDNTYMKDYLTYQMMAEMGVASPLCSYVYITVNGEDWGLYLAVEGVEDSFLKRNFGNNYGKLYKPDSMSMGGGRGNGKKFEMPEGQIPEGQIPEGQIPDGGIHNGSDDVLLKYIDDEIASYANIFDNAKTDITTSDKMRLIKALKKLNAGEALSDTVEIETVIRYFVVHNFILNFDSYTGSMIHNYYLYEKDGQMQMIPWDYNLAFGGFQSMDGATNLVNYPIDTPVSDGNTEDRPMIAWIFENEEYTELYHTIFAEFLSAYFDSGYFENMFDSVTEMIAPYVEKDPTKFCTYDEFEKGISTLREFCLLRAKSINEQLNGSIGSTHSTQDDSTFVDAGELQMSDMGTMNHSMVGNKKAMDGNKKPMDGNKKPMGGNKKPMGGEVPHMPNSKNK